MGRAEFARIFSGHAASKVMRKLVIGGLIAVCVQTVQQQRVVIYAQTPQATGVPDNANSTPPQSIDTGEIAAALMARTSFQVTLITTGANGPGTFDGRFFNQPQAMVIKDTEGQFLFYYTQLGSREWFALAPPKWVAVAAGSDNEKYAQRLTDIVTGGIFASFKSGVSAVLTQANQNVSGIPCAEYSWTDDTTKLAACIDPLTYLPVRKNVDTGALQVTVLFSHFGDSLNGFKIPGESTDTFYIANAQMVLNTLDNFRYSVTVQTQKDGEATPIVNFSQGSYDQGSAAWQADQWYGQDSAKGAPDEQYIQIGLTRWSSTLKQAKGQFVVSDLGGAPSTATSVDVADQIAPLALWRKIAVANAVGTYVPSKTKTFQGKTAYAYSYHFSSDPSATLQATEDVTIYALADSRLPIYAEDVLTETASKTTFTSTWQLTAINDPTVKIAPPLNVLK
jgi:hypothetical protein